MDIGTEIRSKFVFTLLSMGLILILLGYFSNSSWGTLWNALGVMIFVAGSVMLVSMSVVQGLPWFSKFVSQRTEPVWDGGLVHAEGSGLKVRYDFDHKGNPWFVAKDVCIAIGVKPPKKDDLKCADVPILEYSGYLSFSEEGVQAYLILLALNNHSANRLLVNIRNNVLRKLAKHRENNNVNL